MRAGQRVTLTVHGEPIADIVPHERRTRWLQGEPVREELRHRSADSALQSTLDELVGSTLGEISSGERT